MASFDLGALVSGLSRGMGDFTQIQFAEQLLRDREQRRFAQEQQLAQEQFDRRKQLEMLLMDERARREVEKIGALSRGEAMKEKGVQRGEALTQGRMRSAYEKFPEYAVNEALGLDDNDTRLSRLQKQTDIDYKQSLIDKRNEPSPLTGGITDYQRIGLRDRYISEFKAAHEKKMDQLFEVAFAPQGSGYTQAQQQNARLQWQKLNGTDVEQAAIEYAEGRLKASLGTGVEGGEGTPTLEEIDQNVTGGGGEPQPAVTAHESPGILPRPEATGLTQAFAESVERRYGIPLETVMSQVQAMLNAGMSPADVEDYFRQALGERTQAAIGSVAGAPDRIAEGLADLIRR